MSGNSVRGLGLIGFRTLKSKPSTLMKASFPLRLPLRVSLRVPSRIPLKIPFKGFKGFLYFKAIKGSFKYFLKGFFKGSFMGFWRACVVL